jgi:hypothetical protein
MILISYECISVCFWLTFPSGITCLSILWPDNKLLQKKQIDLQNKKRKSNQKKITGFQFLPGSSSKVLITSADSRIRVVDGFELVHKFKGIKFCALELIHIRLFLFKV